MMAAGTISSRMGARGTVYGSSSGGGSYKCVWLCTCLLVAFLVKCFVLAAASPSAAA